jgi:hypothetical protein
MQRSWKLLFRPFDHKTALAVAIGIAVVTYLYYQL